MIYTHSRVIPGESAGPSIHGRIRGTHKKKGKRKIFKIMNTASYRAPFN